MSKPCLWFPAVVVAGLALAMPAGPGADAALLQGRLPASATARARPGYRDSPEVLESFVVPASRVAPSTVVVLGDGREIALGAVISSAGLVVTKSSELEGALTCRLMDGREVGARVLARDVNFDVALLQARARGLRPVAWDVERPLRPGRIVLSVAPSDLPLAMGIVGVAPRELVGGRGFLGVQLEPAADGAQVTRVLAETPALAAGIAVGDIILAINGEALADMGSVVTTIGSHAAGETIAIRLRRGDRTIERDATLAARPSTGGRGSSFEGERSRLRSGFPSVLQHDCVLHPEQCGGPLVALDGRVVGLNIARAGRTTSYAIPARVMVRLIKALEEQAQVAREHRSG